MSAALKPKPDHMRHSILPVLPAACLLAGILGTRPVQGQPQKPYYAHISYVRVEPGKAEAYLKHFTTYGQQILQDRKDRGEILGWSVFSVVLRTDRSDDHNFVFVTTTPSIQSVTGPSETPLQTLRRLRPDMDEKAAAAVMDRLAQVQQVVREEVLLRLDQIPSLRFASSGYYEMRFVIVSPGREGEYERIESEGWKPVHLARQEAGEINYWSLWRRSFPRADAMDYGYVTMTPFTDIDRMAAADIRAAHARALPAGDFDQLTARTRAAGTVVRSEVWKREIPAPPAK
jgi:hypothetical protein